MLFKIVTGLVLFIAIGLFFFGDRIAMMQGDTFMSVDYPVSAYKAYQRLYLKYPKSPLRAQALEKMKKLEKDGYVTKVLKNDKKGKAEMKKLKRSNKNQRYH